MTTSAAGNGSDDVAFPHRASDLLDDGEDVTLVSDRDLVLRAVNSSLRTEQAIGTMLAELSKNRQEVRGDIARIDGKIGALSRQTRALSKRLGAPVPSSTEEGEMRPKQGSRPSFDEERPEETTGPHAALTVGDFELAMARRDRDVANAHREKLEADAKASAAKLERDELERKQRNELAEQRKADRRWAVAMIFITFAITGALAFITRLIEASSRGHW